MVKEKFISAIIGTLFFAVFQPFGMSDFGMLEKMKMKEINWTATNHYKYARARGKIIDFIVGDVLLCPRSMVR